MGLLTDLLGDGNATYALGETHADTTVLNTTVETALATYTLPVNAAPGDIYRLTASGNLLNNSGANANYLWRTKVGASIALETPGGAVGTSAVRRKWAMWAEVHVGATTSEQRVTGWLEITTSSSASWQQFSFGYAGDGAAAEDLGVAKTITFTVALGVAATTVDVICTRSALVKAGKAP